MLFQKYKELIESIFNGITKGDSTATLADYFSVIKYSFLIIGILGLTVFVFFLTWKLLVVVWKKTTAKVVEEINQLMGNYYQLTSEEIKKIGTLKSKLKKIKAINIFGIACIYVPCIIPLVLILIDIVVRFF